MSPQQDDRRPDPGKARPDHHDPTGGIGGAAPAHSALTLRLVLASFGLVALTVFAVWNVAVGGEGWITVMLVVLLVVTLVDLGVVLRRKRRGEPG
ncbi:DUF6343 family protein [Ornithinimicrobium sediminis]|uniref:DUF6343 family protein n=1 Tax=Ornithinimicrobium sediminis TaxID=2904603 RepID=UPI001E2DD759|nr:DUF6343 family protein [Ornithinimicrobium sediminis]MCE0487790.1 DUF6343 family protein [Ornithinimicrobium sediminis]